MTAPYLLLSDLHLHDWSQFASTNANGINTRLQIILNEVRRAAGELKEAGGSAIRIAGDLFHVRGSVDPEVFNPAHQLIAELIADGFDIEAIPGNHDLKGKNTSELGNSFQSFASLKAPMTDFNIYTKSKVSTYDGNITVMMPWQSTSQALRDEVERNQKILTDADIDIAECDLIMHAGIDGVLIGVPDHGITSAEVASWGFKRVFAGHYHNHVVLEGGKVISIGATTHQTWSDVGAKAGFLLVWPDRFEFHASHAPAFVDVDDKTDEDDLPLIVDGNYVRVRGLRMTAGQIAEMREALTEMGARGVSFQVAREVVATRAPSPTAKAMSLDVSVAHYVDGLGVTDASTIKAECADILSTVRSIAA